MRHPPLLAAIGVSLTLAACAVGPDYHAPDLHLPSRWAEAPPGATGQPNLATWWERFNDPLLDRLVVEAVEGNRDVATAKARIREARALRDEAAASLLPELDASAPGTRLRSAATSASPAGEANLFKPGFDASWDLDLFGGNARTVESKTYSVQVESENLRSTLLTLLGDVTRYYVDARGYQARIALAMQSTASQDRTADITERQFAAGYSTGADVAKARAQALNTGSNVPALENTYLQDVHRLGVLLGIGPDAVLSAMATPRSIPFPRALVTAGIPADVVRSRPDVRKAERQLAEQTALIGADEAELYPDVSLSGTLGVSATKVGDLGKVGARTWSFGPSVSLPIFDAGRRLAAVTAQRAVRDEYLTAYQASVLTAMEDVENALVALRKQSTESDRLARSADAYKEAARIARVLYAQGSTSFLDELDAERSLYTSQDSYIQSQVSLVEDDIALFKALGGGWNGRLDVSRPEVVDTDTGPHARPQALLPIVPDKEHSPLPPGGRPRP